MLLRLSLLWDWPNNLYKMYKKKRFIEGSSVTEHENTHVIAQVAQHEEPTIERI